MSDELVNGVILISTSNTYVNLFANANTRSDDVFLFFHAELWYTSESGEYESSLARDTQRDETLAYNCAGSFGGHSTSQ
jgi:hypothetical protein